MENQKLKVKSKKKIFTQNALLVFAFLLFTSLSPSVDEIKKYCFENYGINKINDIIYVSVSDQKLYLIKNNLLVKIYSISTSKYGVGTTENSLKTPVGLHYVRDKQGYNTPLGGILINGKYCGETCTVQKEAKATGKDDVTTRILWLKGCEYGENRGKGKDSYSRQIYIHGTPEEGLIGKPASHGCVRMKNDEVLELFNKVSLGTYVLIK